MEYTVQKLAQLAGITPRTIRFYDEIGLLKPARISSSGYRIYGQAEVNRLQQILFYRELGVGLDRIKELMLSPAFDEQRALREHHARLLEKRRQLDALIANVEKTIAMKEGKIVMTDKERFEGFKRRMLEENERKFGKEIREKYGKEAVETSNQMFLNMTPEQHGEISRLEEALFRTLDEAMDSGDPSSETAQKAADLHRQWLTYFWTEYSKEAHAGVARMYVEDERFTAYYDKRRPGTAEFLRDAVLIYTGAGN